MKKRLIIIFALFTILIIILIYEVYPKSGYFNDLVLSKCSHTQFVDLNVGKGSTYAICTDVNKINEFLAYLKKIQISEYIGKIPYERKDTYLIGIYSDDSNFIGITLQNKNFIEIDMKTDDNRQFSKKYRINNNSLDLKYIEDFCNSITNKNNTVKEVSSTNSDAASTNKGISTPKSTSANLAASENVVKEHFKWWNEKNINKLNTTMTEGNKSISWNLENIDYVKIISIKEDLSSNVKKGYMENGNGKYLKPQEVKVFAVQYEIKLKDDNKGPISSGKHIQYYIVIKQSKNSPWLIDEIGQ